MKYLLDRAKERNTWLGVLALAAVAGLKVSPEQAEAIVTAAVTVAGAIGVFTKG